MARMARVVVPHYPHHVTQRGNRRQKTFFCDKDYYYYRELLASAAQETGTQIWAYCLMPNHVHLIMVPDSEDGLRATLSEAHRRYTRHINFRQNWRGHLWQERFHSSVMDESHLISAVRYVEQNPVVAQLCKQPEDWKWSSARAHIIGADDNLVSVKPMLDLVPDWSNYLSENSAETRNEILRRHTRTGRPLGTKGFIKELERITDRVLFPKTPGRKVRES